MPRFTWWNYEATKKLGAQLTKEYGEKSRFSCVEFWGSIQHAGWIGQTYWYAYRDGLHDGI